MKKITIAATFLIVANIVNAQFKLGIQAGATINNPSVKALPSADNITAFYPGIIAEISLTEMLKFRPSLNLLKSGYENTSFINLGLQSATLIDKVDINNLEIPLDIAVPLKVGSGRLLLSAGPSVVIGLNGTQSTTFSTSTSSNSTKNNIQFGDGQAEIKKVNWGSRFGVGYQFKKGLGINAAYNLGFTNLNNNQNEEYKNNTLSLTASYFFIK